MNIGRYEVKDTLGKGGMGSVLRAYDPNLERFVAIKTLTFAADDLQLPAMRERFKREARNAAQLAHPNIVVIHDFTADQDPAYIVMELIEGRNLRQLLKQNRQLPLKEKLLILRETALALDYAHTRNVIHRDVKPENIMIRNDGVVKLTDFGIAKSLEPSMATHTLTEAGMIAGTPDYIPPEALDGDFWGRRGDQYSLAVVAYETLLGRKPFSAPTLYSLFYMIKTAEPPAVRTFSRHFPEPAYAVLIKALSKDPEKRYSTCLAIIDALSTSLAGYHDAEHVLHDIQEEMSVWNQVESSREPTAFREFLQRYPESQFKEEANRRLQELQLEHASWHSVRENNTSGALRSFLERFPEGAYADTARRLLESVERESDRWAGIRERADPAEIERFLQEFPDGRYETAARELLAELAAETAAWNAACQQNSERSYRLFVMQYPGSRRATEADRLASELQREQQAWTRIRDSNDVIAYRDFLVSYPDGPHANIARARGDTLWREQKAWRAASAARTEAALEEFLAGFPTGAYRAEAGAILDAVRRESAAWRQTRQTNDAAQLEAFLQQFPQSANAGEARRRLDALQADHASWTQASSRLDRDLVTSYLQQHPQGVHAGEATQALHRIEQEWLSWQNVDATNVSALERFLADFPLGQFAEEARKKLAEEKHWQAAKRDTGRLEAFVEANPDSPHAMEARALIEQAKRRATDEAVARFADEAWKELQQSPSVEGLTGFLEQFPASRHAREADALRGSLERSQRQSSEKDERAWEQIAHGDERALRNYLTQYPQGRHAVEAKRDLDGMQAEQTVWNNVCLSAEEAPLTEFLQRYPRSIYTPDAQQRLMWLRTAAAEWSTLESSWDAFAVQGFQKRYPGSKAAGQAAGRLKSIETMTRAWGLAEREQNPDKLRAFAREYAGSPFAERARQLLAALEEEERYWRGVSPGDRNALDQYISRWPGGRYRGEADEAIRALDARAKEDAAWAACHQRGDAASCRQYLQLYGASARAAEVRTRLAGLEAEAWGRVPKASRESLADFLITFPDGAYAAEAQAVVRKVERRKRNRLIGVAAAILAAIGLVGAAYYVAADVVERRKQAEIEEQRKIEEANRLKEQQGQQRAQRDAANRASALQEDARDWQTAQSKPGPDAWRIYLNKHPGGTHAGDANRLMENWQQAESRWKELQASSDPKELQDCAQKYASTPFGTECRTRLNQVQGEETAWSAAKSSKEERVIEAFLNAFPRGKYAAEARNKLDEIRNGQKLALDRALVSKDPTVIRIFLNDYPSSPAKSRVEQHLRQAEMDLGAAGLRASTSERDLDDFLKKYPEYTGELRTRLDDLRAESRFRQARDGNSEEELKKFTRDYPSRHKQEIDEQLRRLEAKRLWPGTRDSKDPARIAEFANKYKGLPEADEASRLAGDLGMEAAWAQARNSSTEEALRKFLTDYPNNRHQKEVESMLAALESKRVWAAVSATRDQRQIEEFLKKYGSMPEAAEARRLLEELRKATGVDKTGPARVPLSITQNDKDGLMYVAIPDGTVKMGCVPGDRCGSGEFNPPTPVRLAGFRIGRTEVTVEAYRKFVDSSNGKYKMPSAQGYSKGWREPFLPIHNIVASEAAKYCEWVGGRLPSEAEWEYAARGGVDGNIFPTGKTINKTMANFGTPKGLEPAGRQANEFKLLNMAGNASEFAVAGADPKGTSYVLKGGGFGSPDQRDLRVSYRLPWTADKESGQGGFRCVW